MRQFVTIALLLAAPFALGARGCLQQEDEEQDGLTWEDAQQALDEVSLANEALNFTSGSVELTTDFTIGDAVEAAAAEIRDFIESQMPCAEVTLAGATLTVEYGALDGACFYNGHQYSGTHTVTVVSAAAGNLVVQHEWEGFSNGEVTVDAEATVTWSGEDASRHLEYDATWTRLEDGKTGQGSGDRTQTLLEGGLFDGIQVDGTQQWAADGGSWDLTIDGVEIRWVDAVPQDGSYTLETPFGITVTMSFERVDSDTINVEICGGEECFDFDVTTLPA